MALFFSESNLLQLQSSASLVESSLSVLLSTLSSLSQSSSSEVRVDVGAREVMMGIARIYTASLLLKSAQWKEASEGDAIAAQRSEGTVDGYVKGYGRH